MSGVTTEQLAEKTKQVYGGLKPSSGDLLNKYLYPLINQGSPLLRYKLETPYDYPISRLKLYYDLSSLKENADYEEAKLHWEQDLNDIRIDPEVIEAQINALLLIWVYACTSRSPFCMSIILILSVLVGIHCPLVYE